MHVRSQEPSRRWDQRWLTAGAIAMSLAIAAAPAAAAPILGQFKSSDMTGGVFLTGRWSEGFVSNDPDHLGNGAHACSWDGAIPATQWEVTGPTLLATVDSGIPAGGNGTRVLDRTFDTSVAFLTLKASPWWTALGDSDYTVDLDYYVQTLTVLYVGGVPALASSTESLHGSFVGYPGHMLAGQAGGAYVGQGAPLGAGYPSWVPATVVSGAWGDVGLIRFTVTPEPATLGLMGLGAMALALARRRQVL